jgi:hypothetical protein
MEITKMTSTNEILTLRQIASWQIPGIPNGNSKISARVPSLQRGAVWEPQQIEMLWDSIFRGFPIGSIVIIKKGLSGQRDKSIETQAKDNVRQIPEGETTHHILDGQQRCNAIAWGFADPWNEGICDDVVLWLDLNPKEGLLKNTTRKYLFRLTTKAHPWGFQHGDEAKYLDTAQRRYFRENLIKAKEKSGLLPPMLKAKLDKHNVDIRPSPNLALPYDANFPVPLFLLFKHFDVEKGALGWDALAKEDLVKFAEVWSGISISSLIEDDDMCANIESGLSMAEQSGLIALQAPDKFQNTIENIEQIFQRLNGQGTPLDKEELIYSMIKAYWPEIEDVMSNLENPPITEVRLVNLGVRIALMRDDGEKLGPELTVKRIREIFDRTGIDSTKDTKDINTIQNYFEIKKENDFTKTLDWINSNFLYDEKTRPYGLPAYLRSSIAWSSQEVFAWLMLLAKQSNYKSIDDRLTKKIIGFALTIHWFGVDKGKAVDELIKIGHDKLLHISIKDFNVGNVLIPLSPKETDDAFQLNEDSKPEQLKNWTSFWEGVVNKNDQGEKCSVTEAESKRVTGLFIEKLRSQKELLVYAQRGDIAEKFKNFDPSNKLMWKGHNRPWDYDHILPSNDLDGRRCGSKTYTEVCQAWQQSIGNLVAVDSYFNRAAQDKKKASEKYDNDEHIKDGAFDIKTEDTDNLAKAKPFVLAAKNRLISIYKDWYNLIALDQGRTPIDL